MTKLLVFVTIWHFASVLGAFARHDICNFNKELSPSEVNHLRPCCNDLCKSNETFALCAEHHDNLTYIPKLNDTVIMLNFSFNYMDSVTDITFENISVSKVQSLWLQHNYITNITSNTFNNFTSLRFLDLRGNPISQEDLPPALCGMKNTKVDCLALSNTKLTYVDKDMFKGVKYVRGLIFSDNNIETFDFSVLRDLKELYFLDLSYNNIFKVRKTFLSNLMHLQLNSNNLRYFPEFCRDTQESPLRILDLSHNHLVSITSEDLKCFRLLKELYLVTNQLNGIESNVFSYFSKIEILQLDHVLGQVRGSAKVQKYAFNNSQLKMLYANDLEIDFEHAFSKHALKGYTKLESLSLMYNRMKSVDEDYMMELLGDLNSLKVLRLDYCQLKFYPGVISKRLKNIKEIHMYSNKVRSLKAGSFDGLKNLDKVLIASNSIHTIDSGAFSLTLQNQLVYVDLCNNSFSCTCDILWFIKWMKKDSKKFGGYPNYYRCDIPNKSESTRLIDTSLSDQLCSMSSLMLPLITTISVLAIVSVVIISVLYRWRWHIRYHIHMLRYKRQKRRANEDENPFTFDAFVLFCEDDFGFVREHILPRIEDDGGMRLCVHQRDFTPGRYIVDNIIESIENSRKVLLLLSNTFSESSWCEFELSLVQTRALEMPEGYLVVVLLEDLNAQNMTSSLYALLQTTTYIQLPAEQGGREIFWERVKQVLNLN